MLFEDFFIQVFLNCQIICLLKQKSLMSDFQVTEKMLNFTYFFLWMKSFKGTERLVFYSFVPFFFHAMQNYRTFNFLSF